MPRPATHTRPWSRPRPTPTHRALHDRTRQPRVLAIDEDPDTTALYKAFLEAKRADVHTATEARAAIPLVGPDWTPHALITHVRLADMTGADLARAVEHRARRSVPAIATTSDARPKACDAVLAQGFKRCLVKPVELDDLATAVFDVMRS